MNFIATSHEAAEVLARKELESLVTRTVALAPGVILCDSESDFSVVSEFCRSGRSLFVRHVSPVQVELEEPYSPAQLVEALSEYLGGEGSTEACVVHLRTFGMGSDFDKRIFKTAVEELLVAHEISIDRVNHTRIISIILTPDRCYAGVCDAELCLSSWPGGEVRYRHDEQMVSRAELKLVEAMDVLKFAPAIQLPVLDLGASPGGWTRVLALKGFSVVAVDPAELDPAVRRMRGVEYHAELAERFIRAHPARRFGALLNDMRMESRASAAILVDCAPLLVAEGVALMTVKLEKESPNKTFQTIQETFSILDEAYERTHARQLFHNRSEVTVSLRIKG